MSREYSCYTGAYTLGSAQSKSAWLVNPVQASVAIIEIGISMDNVTTNAEPVKCELYRVTTIGTPTGTTGIINALDEAYEASSTTVLTQLTAEPSAITNICGWYIQPNSGLIVIQYPLGREPRAKAAGARLGLKVITATNVTPLFTSYVYWAE